MFKLGSRRLVWLLVAMLPACSENDTPQGVNLLENPSFEEMAGGIPRGWQLSNFRGLSSAKPTVYGVDDTLAYDGKQSFYFQADLDTRRFYLLSQEVEVKGARRVSVRMAKRTLDLDVHGGQYPQAGVALTYYDENHARFNSTRFADARIPLDLESTDGWVTQERIFRLPAETQYVVFHCVLGMSGQIWFDDVSMEIPTGMPWLQQTSGVFTHYWLAGTEYPEGSIEYQLKLHNDYASRLGIPQDAWKEISYYLYPDTASIRKALGIKGHLDVSYDAREIHSIDPVDDHEIVHLLTDVYGRLPHILGEGTAYYLQDDLNGKPVQPQAQEFLLAKRIPSMETMFNPANLSRLDAEPALAAGASFVGYLLEYGGTERFLELHRQLSPLGANTFVQVFEQVYGSFEDAERVWRLKLASADFSKFKEPQEEQK